MTFWCLSLETVTISSRVRIDVRISAVANRVADKYAVLLDPFIRNTENLSLYSPVVSSEIFNPQRFRRINQRIDDTEMRFAFILVHLAPLTGQFSFLGVSSAVSDKIFMGNSEGFAVEWRWK